MKSIFIAFNQAYNEEIADLLEAHGQRGYTRWVDIHGRGSVDGEPHLGNHAWPTMNIGIMTVVPDEKVAGIMADLKAKNEAFEALGLRAFVWNIEESI